MEENTIATFQLTEIEHATISKIVDGFPQKTSSGADRISPKQLKDMKSVLLKPITLIINQILHIRILPDKLKLAKVIPIYKSGEKSLFTHYRQISLLPVVYKIIEKIIYNELYAHRSISCITVSAVSELDIQRNWQLCNS